MRMNELFVATDKYGDLRYDEIFLYYDGPCIFSVKNKLGYRFICLLESETSELCRYIVVPVSIERYYAFVRNNWSIRRLFTMPEQGGVFSVTFGDNGPSVASLEIAEINSMNLPDDNVMLDYNGSYTSKEILLDSAEKNVPILQKSLEKNGEHRQYIYAGELARESLKFQKIFDGIANDEIRQLPKAAKDKINEIRNACRVPIYATYPASFGIQIEGTDYPRIGEEETNFAKYLKLYFELLNINDETESDFFEYHRDALNALRGYYKSLISLGFNVKLAVATPKHEYYKCYLSKEDIISRYGFLNQITANDVEQVTLTGTWAQIDIEKKSFRFRINTGENISGKFDDDFDESVFDFSKEIKILVDKKKETGRMGDESEKYILLAIVTNE